MATKTVHVKVSGRVQGVFFRACTADEANKLSLAGWVRNLPDGSVEAEIQGEERDIDRMIAWLHQGSPNSIVNEVIVTSKEVSEPYSRFDVRY